jgi:hypothetical protein
MRGAKARRLVGREAAVRPTPRVPSSDVATPRPNPDTVAALLDTTWRVAANEAMRTDAIDRKAATLVTFASLLTAIAAALGVGFVETADSLWALSLFTLTLVVLLSAVGLAVAALFPREFSTLGLDYVRRFPRWGEIARPPEDVRGETMLTLIAALTSELSINDDKIRLVKGAYVSLAAALVLIAAQSVTLAAAQIA